MPAALADTLLYRSLFQDQDSAEVFTEAAELQAMLQIEAALAKVQGAMGIIPQAAAGAIGQICRETKLNAAELAAETGLNGVPVPALLAALRRAHPDCAHLQYLHWGATSQDIIDSGLALRLMPLLDLWQARIAALLAGLARLATAHAELPMAARSYGQIATPTSFGAVVAAWGWPLLGFADSLQTQRTALSRLSLSGAAGTLAAMGLDGPKLRAALAQELGLNDPGHSWHSDRSGLAGFAAWMAGLMACLGKFGEDLILMAQSGLSEVKITGSGGSSTMPQKQNPVAASVLAALARQCIGLSATLQGAALHRQQRDGAAWFTEWLTLPQLCISTGCGLATALKLLDQITPDPSAMARGMDDGLNLIYAESFTFLLCALLPRPDAQAVVTSLCRESQAHKTPLADLLARDFPQIDWRAQQAGPAVLGQAAAEARDFAAKVAARADSWIA
jgi:3-carboxy-cis,cis-muconate cycloisomerase